MTIDEVSKRYNIPQEILQQYADWGLCPAVKEVMEAWEYDDRDIERLSMVMTLHDIGFDGGDVEAYMRLQLQGDASGEERLRLLEQKRSSLLDEIHFKEKQLEHIDYLRHQLRQSKKQDI